MVSGSYIAVELAPTQTLSIDKQDDIPFDDAGFDYELPSKEILTKYITILI